MSDGGTERGARATRTGALVALALAALALSALVPPLLGVATAEGGLALARRSPRFRSLGVALVVLGAALAVYLVLVVWGSGSGSTSVS